jgi:alginate O-acetyltransferase complex protein AlgI
LSHWLRDYLFLPVSYALLKRLPNERTWGVKSVDIVYSVAIMLTMLTCGFWHGAAWTFVIWGALHGLYLIVSHLGKPLRSKLRRALGVKRNGIPHVLFQKGATFALVSLAWVFFRAKSLDDAFYIVAHVVRAPLRLLTHLSYATLAAAKKGLPASFFLIVIAALAMLWLLQKAQNGKDDRYMLETHPIWLRWSFYYAVILAIHFFGAFKTTTDFLYFQF